MDLLFAKNITNNNEADMHIYRAIGGEDGINAQAFVDELNHLVGEMGITKVNVRINSVGGSVADGIGIFSAIRNINASGLATVDTFNDGIAASIASIILLAGHNRFGKPYSRTMIHGISFKGAKDTDENLDAGLKELSGQLAEIFAGYSNKSEAYFVDLLTNGRDNWFKASAALAAGLIQRIDREGMALSTNGVDLTPDNIRNKVIDYQNKLENTSDMKTIAKALGLNEDASEAQIVQAVNALNTKVTEGESKVTDAEAKVATAENAVKEAGEKAAENAVDAAINSGKISKDGKDSALVMAKNDLSAFTTFLEGVNVKAADAIGRLGSENGAKGKDFKEKIDEKTFRELEKESPELLNQLKKEDIGLYTSKYNDEYKTTYKETYFA